MKFTRSGYSEIKNEVIDLTSIGKYKYDKKYKRPYELVMADKLNNALYYITRHINIPNINMEYIYNKLYTEIILQKLSYTPIIKIIDKYEIEHDFLITIDDKNHLLLIEKILPTTLKIKNDEETYDIINYYTNSIFSKSYLKECIEKKELLWGYEDSTNIKILIKNDHIEIATFMITRTMNSI